MQNKEFHLTKEGFQKLSEELEVLTKEKRKEVTLRIKKAKEFGDLRENSEYDDAKNEQAFVESRIKALKHMLSNAVLIEEDNVDRDVVTIGSTVLLMNLDENQAEDYQIVGTAEADPVNGRISNESPVGEAIIGKREGDVVEAKTPLGFTQYQIIKISRDLN